MSKRDITLTIENLTDEQILKEFVKRFDCDGAILMYMEQNKEYGFGRWNNSSGKIWVNELFKIIESSPISIIDLKKRSARKILEQV